MGNLAGSLAACRPSHRTGSVDVRVWELKNHGEYAMGRCMGQGCCSVDFILEPPEPARGDENPQGPAHKTQRCIDHAFSRLHIPGASFWKTGGEKKKKKGKFSFGGSGPLQEGAQGPPPSGSAHGSEQGPPPVSGMTQGTSLLF